MALLHSFEYNIPAFLAQIKSDGTKWAVKASPESHWSAPEVKSFEAAMEQHPRQWQHIAAKVSIKYKIESC